MMSDKFVPNLDSFAAGVCSALACLKIAIQDSPSFNRERLEQALQFMISHPSSQVDRESFEMPLRFLLSDQSQALENLSGEESSPATH
jgi:hypothetical protein